MSQNASGRCHKGSRLNTKHCLKVAFDVIAFFNSGSHDDYNKEGDGKMEMAQTATTNRNAELEELISVYGEKLLRYATSILYSHQDAEDVVQDVFLSHFRNAHRFDIQNISAWLYRMTYNQCLNKLREIKRRKSFFYEDAKSEPVTYMEDNLTMPDIMKALERLKPQERALLYGRAMDGQSYEELSRIMGISAAALRKQYERVKKKAAKYLNAGGYHSAEPLNNPVIHLSGRRKGAEYNEA